MTRPLVLLLAVVAVLALVFTWLLGGDAAAPAMQPAASPPAADTAATPASAVSPSEAVATRVARELVASEPDDARLPIPDDAVWLEVHIVDASTKAPVPGALVFWSTNATWGQIAKLPEPERLDLGRDQDRLAMRFGWKTRAGDDGVAKIAAAKGGAQVFATSEGRYATGYVGGPREAPEGGWRLELEADRTLRAQVLDQQGQPAVDVEVGILLFDASGKRLRNIGWISPTTSTAPEAIAEFHHIQNWLRGWSNEAGSFSCRVALRIPGVDDPGVAFDREAPPAAPIVLHLPATGSLRARLLHAGRPLVARAKFQVWRGPDQDSEQVNTARRVAADDDGWARFPHVGLGGTLTVVGSCGSGGQVEGEVLAPVASGQEVSIDLDADSIFSLTGMLVGPDGKPLADAQARANFDAEISMGGGMVHTDADGRFLWLLAKGYMDKPTLRRLVLTLTDANGSVLRASLPQRGLTRGVNDLGVIRLSSGSLVVGGRVEFDPPEQRQVQMVVEGLAASPGRGGEERWQRLRDLTPLVHPDGTFEVRGETSAGRHRLVFPAYDHLPIEPVEFAVGTADLVVHLGAGCRVAAKVLVPEGSGRTAVSGVLVPKAPARGEPKPDPSYGTDHHTASSYGIDHGAAELRWQALPSGTYRLEIRAGSVLQPVAVIDDVVLPPPEGGDPRLRAIDIRDAVRVVHLVIEAAEEPPILGRQLIVFPMPQDGDQEWVGMQLPDTGGTLLVPRQPVELLIASPGYQPQRLSCNGPEMRLRLEPWPMVDIAVANLPPLPEGIELHLWLQSMPAPGRAQPRYRTDNQHGSLASLISPPAADGLVVDGRARLPIGDGSLRVGGYLQATGKHARALRTWTPDQITGGPGVTSFTVQLSTAELQQELAALQGSAK